MTMWPRRALALLASVAATAAACTGTDAGDDTAGTEPDLSANVVTIPPVPTETPPPADSPPTTDDRSERGIVVDLTAEMPILAADVEVGEPSVARVAGVPLTDIAISWSGRRVASNRGTEICVIEVASGTSTPGEGCADFGDGIADRSMSWSPDESAIAFHHDLFRRQQEPDIVVLDTATLEFDVVTDDGSEDVQLGPVDIAPFYDDAGTLHFFRLDDGPSAQLMKFDDRRATPVDGVRVTPFAARAVRDPVSGRIAVTVPVSAETATIQLLDLPSRSVTPTSARDLVVPEISDIRGDRLLIVPLDTGPAAGPLAALVDLDRPVPVQFIPRDIDADRSVTGAGLSPDGSAVVLIIEDRGDPSGHQLVVAPVLDDGSIGPFAVAATGPDFAPNDGDRRVRPHGLGDRNEIEWVDGRMIYGLGPDRIVTLGIAGSP